MITDFVTVWALPRPTLVRVGIAHVRSSIYVAHPTSGSQFSAVPSLSHPLVAPLQASTLKTRTAKMAIIDLGWFGRFEIHGKPREREPPRPTQTERPSNLSPDDAFRYDRSSPAQDDPPPYSVIAPRPTPRPPLSRTYSNSVLELYQIELEEERRAPRRELRSTFHEPRQQGPAQAAKPACKTQQLRR
jgi:hypothetical protein